MKQAIIGLVLTAMFTSAGYGALYLADGRYVRQEAWVQESRASERRNLNRRIDELEFQQSRRQLSDKEAWELRRLKTELQELR